MLLVEINAPSTHSCQQGLGQRVRHCDDYQSAVNRPCTSECSCWWNEVINLAHVPETVHEFDGEQMDLVAMVHWESLKRLSDVSHGLSVTVSPLFEPGIELIIRTSLSLKGRTFCFLENISTRCSMGPKRSTQNSLNLKRWKPCSKFPNQARQKCFCSSLEIFCHWNEECLTESECSLYQCLEHQLVLDCHVFALALSALWKNFR